VRLTRGWDDRGLRLRRRFRRRRTPAGHAAGRTGPPGGRGWWPGVPTNPTVGPESVGGRAPAAGLGGWRPPKP